MADEKIGTIALEIFRARERWPKLQFKPLIITLAEMIYQGEEYGPEI